MTRIKITWFQYVDRNNTGYSADEANRRDVMDVVSEDDLDARFRLLQLVALALNIKMPNMQLVPDKVSQSQ